MKINLLILSILICFAPLVRANEETSKITTIDPGYRNAYLDGCQESCESITKQNKLPKAKRKELIESCKENCQCSSNHLEFYFNEDELLELVRSYDEKKDLFGNQNLKKKFDSLTQFCLSKPITEEPTAKAVETESQPTSTIEPSVETETPIETMGAQPNQ